MIKLLSKLASGRKAIDQKPHFEVRRKVSENYTVDFPLLDGGIQRVCSGSGSLDSTVKPREIEKLDCDRIQQIYVFIFMLFLYFPSMSDARQQTLSLNLQNTPLRGAIQQVADITGNNVVITDRVSGTVTLHLENVPVDNVFNVLADAAGLSLHQVGNVAVIDTNGGRIALETEKLQYDVSIKKPISLPTKLIPVQNAKAADLAQIFKEQLNSRKADGGVIAVDERTNTLLIQDTPENIQQFQQAIQLLDVPAPEIMIEARIVNVAKNCAEDLGVRFGVANPYGMSGTLEGSNAIQQGQNLAGVPLKERLSLDLAALPLEANPASIGLAIAKLGNDVLLDLELSALESEGRAEIIARPQLMTINQKPAIIESGEDIPYQETTLSGATAVAFKKAVLSLKVTPQVTRGNQLLIDLQINQDSDSGRRVQGVPIILTKAISTNVLVNNGETIVLGGVYQHDNNNAMVRVPFLGDLPIVGHLFRRHQTRIKHEELLIFITPKIIK